MHKHTAEILILVYILLTLGTLAQERRKHQSDFDITADENVDDDEEPNDRNINDKEDVLNKPKTDKFDSDVLGLTIIKLKSDEYKNIFDEDRKDKDNDKDNIISSIIEESLTKETSTTTGGGDIFKNKDNAATGEGSANTRLNDLEEMLANLILQNTDFDNEPTEASNKDATNSELWSEPKAVVPEELSPEERAGMLIYLLFLGLNVILY